MYTTELEKKLQEIRAKKEILKGDLQKSRIELINIRNIVGSGWWYPASWNSNVYFDYSKKRLYVDLSEKKHLYLSYKENNIAFSNAPESPIVIEDDIVTCEFTGAAYGNVKATLYLIGYKEKKKQKVYRVALNSKQIINLDSLDSYRLAIKLEGSGEFSLKQVVLGSEIFEGFSEMEEEEKEKAAEPIVVEKVPSPEIVKTPVAEKVTERLDLQSAFSNVINVELSNMTAPANFASYVTKEDEEITFDIPEGRYAYLQHGTGPLFQMNDGELMEEVNASSYYEFGLSASESQELIVELIVVGFCEGSPIEAKRISNNSKVLVKFKKETTNVKYLIRVQGKGSISSIGIGVNSIEREATNQTVVQLNEEEWFNAKNSQCELHSDGGQLTVSSKITGSKAAYISYKEKNNSFSKVPAQSTFEVNPNSSYEFMIESAKEGDGAITPILITYSENSKEEIINLKLNEVHTVVFKESIKYCRVAFKLNGNAQLQVRQFKIEQFPIIETFGEMKWLDSKEVALLGLVERKDLKTIKMAAIFDEFTTQCFAHECQLITFTPENWKEVLEADMPDLLMVESAWRGNNGAWVKKVQYQNEDSVKDLKQLLYWCKQKNVPTVFWNKEDPVHYEHFIGTAKLFDFVLTTDSNMVPVYKEACGHDRVDYLQFAAQPTIHNPITIGERESALSFAGSYYAQHVERTEDMMNIFNVALPYGLAIFDRNYEKVKQGLLPNNRFPEHVAPYVRGSLKYYEIDKAYKGFKAMININTVKNSPTMFARRVYESLASGTPILSNYSEGIEKIFGDLVCTAKDNEDINAFLKKIFEDEQAYRAIALEGIRTVLSEHTYAHRMEKLVEMLNLPFKKTNSNVVVLASAESIEDAQQIISEYNKQTYEFKRLILVTDSEVAEHLEDDSISVFTMDNFTSTYSNLVEIENCDYLALMDASIAYDEHHLLDLVLATQYAPWEMLSVQNEEELSFKQIEKGDPSLSIFKPAIFSLLSSFDALYHLTVDRDIPQFKAMGGRVLGITTN